MESDQKSEKVTVNVQPWMIIREAPVPIKEEPVPAAADEYMTTKEAAAYLKLHVKTLQKWVRLVSSLTFHFPESGRITGFQKP